MTPWSCSAWAVSSAVSPAPMITHAALGEVAERVARRASTATEATLARPAAIAVSRAHALAGRQRGAEELVGQRPGRARGQRRLVGALDLALDLGLADDHRLQPAGDAVEVARGVAVAQASRRRRPARSAGCRPGGRARPARRPRPRRGRRRRGRARCGCRSRSRPPRGSPLARAARARKASARAVGQRQPLAQRQRRGLVRDAEREQLAHRRAASRTAGRGSSAARSRAASSSQLVELALDARELGGHDRHVDQHQREEDQVGRRDVRPGVVERQRGHQSCWGAALRAAGARAVVVAGEPAPQRAQLRSRRAWRSARTCTASRTAAPSPTRQMRKVSRISPGIGRPSAPSTRGWMSASAEAHGHEVQRHEGAGDDREHARRSAPGARGPRSRSAAAGSRRRAGRRSGTRRASARPTPTSAPHEALAQIEPVISTPTPRISDRWIAT